jgi:hypothetical protein
MSHLDFASRDDVPDVLIDSSSSLDQQSKRTTPAMVGSGKIGLRRPEAQG